MGYRNLISKVRPPCVPFLGICLKDMTEIEHGSPDMIGTMINFEKRIHLGRLLMQIKNLQSIHFRFEHKNDLLWQVVHLPKKDYSLPSTFLSFSKCIEPENPEKMVEELLMKEKVTKNEIIDIEHQLDRYAIDIRELERENKILEQNL